MATPKVGLQRAMGSGRKDDEAPTIAKLTDNSGGTANDTLEDVPAAYDEAALANNFADLAAKVNAILDLLADYGLRK